MTLPTVKVDILTTKIEDYLDPHQYLGYEFENKVRASLENKSLDKEKEKQLRDRCIQFVVKLIAELRQRLPDNIDILQKTDLLSVSKALTPLKESLTPLLEKMHTPAKNISLIENQWNIINLIPWEHTQSTVTFWSEVYNYKDATNLNPFKELADFALSVLTLPHSNAEIERVFSQMHLIKNKLRNRMKSDMANAILSIRAGLKRAGKNCYNYELPKEVTDAIGTSAVYNTPGPAGLESPSTSGAASSIAEELDDDSDEEELFL